MAEISLIGKRILVVEDEALLGALLEDLLEELGCVVAGTATSTAAALQVIDLQAIDGAIVDINLGSGPNYEVAERLDGLGVPFMFSTGYDSDLIAGRFSAHRVLAKPFDMADLKAALQAVLA